MNSIQEPRSRLPDRNEFTFIRKSHCHLNASRKFGPKPAPSSCSLISPDTITPGCKNRGYYAWNAALFQNFLQTCVLLLKQIERLLGILQWYLTHNPILPTSGSTPCRLTRSLVKLFHKCARGSKQLSPITSGTSEESGLTRQL